MTDPDTRDPIASEAQAQDEQTVMPWIWGAVGGLVVVAFIAWMIFAGGHHPREPTAAAPLTHPPALHD